MHDFIKYSRLDRSVPLVSGAYNIICTTRDRIPVIDVAYYNKDTSQWYRRCNEEYGYCDEFRISDEFIQYFKQIEGVEFVVIPEKYNITIAGYNPEEDD